MVVVLAFIGVRVVEQLITREKPDIVTGLVQYPYYQQASDQNSQSYDLQEQSVDIIVRIDDDLAPSDDATRSKYGTVAAYQVQGSLITVQQWISDKSDLVPSHRGADSVAEVILNADH